jgi:hypothetical protein
LEVNLFVGGGRNYVPRPEDMVQLRQLVDDYWVLGRRVVADQFEDALQRHLVTAVADYTTDIAPGGHWNPNAR